MDNILFGRLLNASNLLIDEDKAYKTLEEADAFIGKITTEHGRLKRVAQESASSTGVVGQTIIGCAMFALSAMCFLSSLLNSLIPLEDSGEPAPFVLYLVLGIVLAAPGLIVGFVTLYKRKSNQAAYKKIAAKHQKQLEEYEKEWLVKKADIEEKRNTLAESLKNLVSYKAEFLDFLPYQYRELFPVVFMTSVIGSGRAETLKEAMNMYEEELKYIAMLNAIQSTNRRLDAINSSLEYINANIGLIDARVSQCISIQTMDFLTS